MALHYITGNCTSLQYSAVHYITLQCSALHYDTVQYTSLQNSAVLPLPRRESSVREQEVVARLAKLQEEHSRLKEVMVSNLLYI